jgi:purine-binding chemotaxis protein CheW
MNVGALQIEKVIEKKPVWNVFCSFLLGNLEVVLPLEMIQEVVNYPESVNKIPLSPDFLDGVFNLRGMVIPIANMHMLMKTPGEVTENSKIAIVKLKEIKVGLVFDKTSEILKVTNEEVCLFDYGPKGSGMIQGALKLDGGERILQIIDPEMLLNLEKIPHIIDKIKLTGQKDEHKSAGEKLKRKQCISFLCDDVLMAFEMEFINEILKFEELKPSFVNYDYSLGLLTLRGGLVPIINFSKFLSSKDSSSLVHDGKKILIISMKDGHRLGLLVDSAEDIIPYFENELFPITQMGSQKKDLFKSVLKKNDKEVVVLNSEVLLKHSEITHIVDGHARLFKEAVVQNAEKKKIKKQVYLSFRISGLFSLEIHEVREIVAYPAELMEPPGTKSYISGLFKLRDKVITVIDMRKFYGLPELEDLKDTRILIVERGNENFGLMVDSLAEIFSVNIDEKFPLPAALASKAEQKLSHDMKELVLLCDKRSGKDSKLIVLDLMKILSKISQ